MNRNLRRLLPLALLLLALAGCGAKKSGTPPPELPEEGVKEGEEAGRTIPPGRRPVIRVAIALEGGSLAAAGYGSGRITDPAGLAYMEELERRQDEIIARIEEVLGHPLDVAHRFTRSVNVISANVLPEEAELIRGVEGVTGVTEERLNRPDAVRPGAARG